MSKNSCKNGTGSQNMNAKNQASNKASDQSAADCTKKTGKNTAKDHTEEQFDNMPEYCGMKQKKRLFCI